MELVDREEILKNLPDDLPYKGSVKRVLYQADVVEAEPVRHGKWEGYHGEKFCKDGEYRHFHFYVCSNCGRRTAVTSKYCPDCGCLMDGD